MPVVELVGVTKAYDTKIAVSHLNLSIEAGQMFGLLGPNGAGKTSSIRMMMGILVPSSGRVLVGGHDCQGDPVTVKRHVGNILGKLGVANRARAVAHARASDLL